LAGNLEKLLLSLYGAEWRAHGYGLGTILEVARQPICYKFEKIFFIFSISSETSRFVTATVAAFDVSPNDLSRNVTTRLQIFGSERHVKKHSTFFSH
jgi:hypothetical protein